MNRELIYGSLFAQLAAIPGFVTSSRTLKHWTDVPEVSQPAVYQSQGREVPETKTGLPTKWELNLTIYLYARGDGITPTSEILNPLLDAVCAVIQRRHPVTGTNNLGGTVPGVEWARISGPIDTDEGSLGNQGVAIIPVQILVTD